jgi:hypothetical protein
MNPSEAIRLTGTEEPVVPPTLLTAGPLTAEFSAGNLRYIRVGGDEALRAVAYLVRDRNWGTYNADITDLNVKQEKASFSIAYKARTAEPGQSFRYTARIDGRADGSLIFDVEGVADDDFVTCRTGFVVLHALAGVVGEPVTVEHVDGRVVESTFPALVNPACPFMDIRALTHTLSSGVRVACRMEGEAFEMEDHRNWMDASYKTYVRPLAKPWPYTLKKGEAFRQTVTLTLTGKPKVAGSGSAAAVTVTIGDATGHRMPRIGLAADPDHIPAALEKASLLKTAGPSHLVCRFDARRGHGPATMDAFRALGAALGAPLVLEAVLPCVDASGKPTGDIATLARDMAHVGVSARAAGAIFERVAVSPATDLKCTLPGSIFPPAPTWGELFAAARTAFPGVPVGGGMFSFFTELNRKRPPADLIDFVCHTGIPLVHAGDDTSMTETLEALPSQVATTRSFAGGKPYWIFPTAVAMRENPYGAVPAENPDNIRQAMNRVDPRERALIGAAWYAGLVAHAARAGLDAVTLAAVAGPSGIVATRQPHAQPWFDESGAVVVPSFHVLSAAMGLAGGQVLAATSSAPRDVQSLAVTRGGQVHLILSNLRGTTQMVRIDGVKPTTIRLLDADAFPRVCLDPWSFVPSGGAKTAVTLPPYAVAMVEAA